jgi:hypothetical protein
MSEEVLERIGKTIMVIVMVILFHFAKSYIGFESAVFVGLSLALVELWYMSSHIQNKDG